MKTVLILACLGLAAGLADGQAEKRIIKSGQNQVDLEVDGRSIRRRIGEAGKLNVFELDVPDGKSRTVKYTSDLESFGFSLKPGEAYDFTIEKDGIAFRQQVIGIRLDPDLLKIKRFLLGENDDVVTKLHGPVLDLDGGSKNFDGIQPMINKVRGCANCPPRIDIVVISATTFDVTNPFSSSSALNRNRKRTAEFYTTPISKMEGADSVELLYFTDPADANGEEAARTIESAEIVFIAGGSQCDYLKAFRGTRVEKAIEAVYKRGGGIGGSSAGQAVLGDFIFDGCNVTTMALTSEIALADPYDSNISFSRDLFNWKFLKNTITDQHVVERDRIGRTFAFVARQLQDGKAKMVHAIAVDQGTSVVVDRGGIATVVGTGNSYFITGDHKPEVCEKGKPLTYSNFKVWRVKSGEAFNLKKRPKNGYYAVSVTEGKLSRDPY